MDPDEPSAVYRLYDAYGVLLYIGLTCNPASRWKDHRKEMLWWPEVVHRHLTWYGSRREAWDAERAAIRSEGARYNKGWWPDMVPNLPPGVAPQPHGARTAYQFRETRVSHRILWYHWRLTLQDVLETRREQAGREDSDQTWPTSQQQRSTAQRP
ncbi:GIY-YIG nuclease family protein [Streptomyces sp. NPDC004610]|uniref:GIY-YIG nuclease family protein n=1 Tax=unclassified Streptomyces TaxID=2593676 RepID=UPI0033B868C1